MQTELISKINNEKKDKALIVMFLIHLSLILLMIRNPYIKTYIRCYMIGFLQELTVNWHCNEF